MKKEQSTALVAANQNTSLALQVRGWGEVETMGQAFAKSGFFGEITPSTGAMIAMTCIEEGISPLKFKKQYHVINGTPSITTRALVGKFKQLGGKMKLHEVSKDKCDITFSYDGNEIRTCVTLQEFVDNGLAIGKGGLMKDNWKKFPSDMLYARCCAGSIRKVCPEADGGLYVAEEVQDFDNRRPVELTPDQIRAVNEPLEKPVKPAVSEVVEEVVEPVVEDALAEECEAEEKSAKCEHVDANDPTICPVKGQFFGKKWTDIDRDILQAVMVMDRKEAPELTDAHIECIEGLLTETPDGLPF